MANQPTLLLTGATGFLGRALRKRLQQEFHLVLQGRSSCPPGGVQADLAKPGEVERLVKDVNPDMVLHAAAARDPDQCEGDVQGTEALNRDVPARFAACLPSTARMLHISTDYVFDGKQAPYSEEEPVSPVNVYGRTKAEAEPAVLAHPGGCVLRIPVLVGEGPGFVQQMLEDLHADEPRVIDNVLIRHPAWIADVADVCAWILSTGQTGLWQASSEQGDTRYQLTCRVGAALGLPTGHLQPSEDVIPRKAERPFNSKLSPRKLLEAGGPACREIEEVVQLLV